MTVEMLIKELQKYDPKARVRMHHWLGEEVLYSCRFVNSDNRIPPKVVWFECEDDLDLGEELKAQIENASEIAEDEADFYALWLERGFSIDMVERNLGKEAAEHMKMVCEEHGLI